LGGSYSVAFCVNEKGEVVGVSETAAGYSHGFLYKDGGMKDLGVIF
jgi:probable HAF family extracellular repeat protein